MTLGQLQFTIKKMNIVFKPLELQFSTTFISPKAKLHILIDIVLSLSTQLYNTNTRLQL